MNAARDHYCRDCRRSTPQRFLYEEARSPGENGRHPKIRWYRCERCDLVLCEMADVTDVEGLVLHVLAERFGRRGTARLTTTGRAGERKRLRIRGSDRWLDYEDALGHLREAALLVYRKWEPSRGVPFTAYATGELRNDLVDWLRVQIGRDNPKPFADAVALDAIGAGDEDGEADAGDDRSGLDAVVRHGAVDGVERSLADLRRVAALRGRALAREERRLGVRANA